MSSRAVLTQNAIERSPADARRGKGRQLAGTALTALACLVLAGSAATKFAHVPRVVQELGRYGFSGGRLIFVACLEAASIVFVLAPPTRRLGLLFVSAYLGGAIATHLQHGSSMAPPAIVLAIFWIATALARPEDFSPLLGG
ncbi:MAG: DoxX family protein [Acidobacteriota bacterium]